MSRGKPERPPNSAAAYVRMSTEHQQYSTSNQMDVIREYAKRRGLEIVKEYSDEGKRVHHFAQRQLPGVRVGLHCQTHIAVPRQFHRQAWMHFHGRKPGDKRRPQCVIIRAASALVQKRDARFCQVLPKFLHLRNTVEQHQIVCLPWQEITYEGYFAIKVTFLPTNITTCLKPKNGQKNGLTLCG